MSENTNEAETQEEQDIPSKHSVAGIRFRSCGKVYNFEINGIDPSPGAKVVVESEMGLSLGTVVIPKHDIEAGSDLKKVIRLASETDLETVENNRSFESEAREFCIEKSKNLGLEMKVVATESTLDRKKLVFYFTADGRIDFRELVRDLASKFKTRIEMRQIGVRDEVKMIGGYGVCGRQTCCSLFLTSFAPVTIRMAKQQDLSINQSKLSGICGRLMCCLGYEVNETRKGRSAFPVQADRAAVVNDVQSRSKRESVLYDDNRPVDNEHVQSEVPCMAVEVEDKKPVEKKEVKEEAARPQGKKKRYFKRDRRRSRKRGPSSDASQEKPVTEGRQPDKKEDNKEKTGPFKRRRFRRKKKQ